MAIKLVDDERCSGCGCEFHGPRHVDRYHRFWPLCTDCYYNPAIAKRTASNPDDPSSWWNRPEIGGNEDE